MNESLARRFEKLSIKITHAVGTYYAFLFALGLVVGWAVSGPFYRWSDSHSLFINTVTTIITFLMVFIIQHSQNKDTMALHIKLDELIKAIDKVDNKYSGIEDLPAQELEKLKEDDRNT